MTENKEDSTAPDEYRIVLEGRRHEIDLFWKRSNIFWLISAAAFAAFYETYTDQPDSIYAIAIAHVGLVCSFCWTLVNRGSKYWMTCWELWASERGDDCFSGPHHSIKKDWWTYRFSVSKLMIVISDFFTLVWALLILYLFRIGILSIRVEHLRDLVPLLTLIGLILIGFVFAKGNDEKELPEEMETLASAKLAENMSKPENVDEDEYNRFIQGTSFGANAKLVLDNLKNSKYRDRSIPGISKGTKIPNEILEAILRAFVKAEIVVEVKWYGRIFYRLTEKGRNTNLEHKTE